MTPQAFWQGVEEFNQQQFYACHDTLEAIWIEAPESDKRFYQGVLQVAVGCYHLSNNNCVRFYTHLLFRTLYVVVLAKIPLLVLV